MNPGCANEDSQSSTQVFLTTLSKLQADHITHGGRFQGLHAELKRVDWKNFPVFPRPSLEKTLISF
ncbi:hypothetical protein BDV11DRAFT_77986 [Aspergillus similis]